jgi:hypothetical protein
MMLDVTGVRVHIKNCISVLGCGISNNENYLCKVAVKSSFIELVWGISERLVQLGMLHIVFKDL